MSSTVLVPQGTSNFRGPPCPIRIHVLLVPSQVDPKYHASRVEAIQETWGKRAIYRTADGRCLTWTMSLAHEGLAFEEPGQLTVLPNEMTPRPEVQAQGKPAALIVNILRAFSDAGQPDWVLKVDDCVFLVPENAISFALQFDADRSFLLGSQLRNAPSPSGTLYVSSAGFFLSRGALRRMHLAMVGRNQSASTWLKRTIIVPGPLSHSPDVGVGALCAHLGVDIPDTRGATGGERFNVFPLAPAALDAFHDWYRNYKMHAGIAVLGGDKCCADDSVFFHWVSSDEIRFLNSVLRDQWFADAKPTERLQRWPSVGKALFDRWDPRLRPDLDGSHSPIWTILERVREHLLLSDVRAISK